jgi:alpha-mannosidase
MKIKTSIPLLSLCLIALNTMAAGSKKSPDLTKEKVLYEIGYSHLDTQWRWAYPQVISEYLPNTVNENAPLFEKYPDYIFNWTGANRYRFMKEYHPGDFAKVRAWVAKGRWFPAGSSWEENDVNVPSSESLIRQILLGHDFFKKEFGTESAEYMIPDCFGFPASLPSVLAHCGLRGFSTQKLTWGSAVGIPFNVGVWEGLDGESIIAALNPGGLHHANQTGFERQYGLEQAPGE